MSSASNTSFQSSYVPTSDYDAPSIADTVNPTSGGDSGYQDSSCFPNPSVPPSSNADPSEAETPKWIHDKKWYPDLKPPPRSDRLKKFSEDSGCNESKGSSFTGASRPSTAHQTTGLPSEPQSSGWYHPNKVDLDRKPEVHIQEKNFSDDVSGDEFRVGGTGASSDLGISKLNRSERSSVASIVDYWSGITRSSRAGTEQTLG